MYNADIKRGDGRRELTYDLYPSDRRVKRFRRAAHAGRTVHDRQAIRTMSYDTNPHGDDRRELTYDFYPGDRRRV